jgi:hypothetical protein
MPWFKHRDAREIARVVREKMERWEREQTSERTAQAARDRKQAEITDWTKIQAQETEIEFLGLAAARCEVWAADWRTSEKEKTELMARAGRYRDLQMKALEDANVLK